MAQIQEKEIENNLVAICNRIGFKKKKYYFIKHINDDVIATLHFGIATHKEKGHIYVNVTVGVSHKKIENLYAQLTENRNLLLQSTIGSQIGYLMPENSFKEWNFAENADNSSVYEDILKNIQIYGFAYYDKMKDFDNLFEAIEKRVPGLLNQARDRYLPILYYLKGDKQKGLKVIDEAIERQNKPIDESKALKFTGAEELLSIVGSGFGKVSPEYLKFAEKYKAL